MISLSTENTPKANREAINESILEMLHELNECEALELEDFIVNHCDNTSFADDDGQYPNLFRIFVTGHKPDCIV
jgi:hypothetical protein